MFASTSVADDVVIFRFLNVPKRERALTIAQRSVAQYGQYSAPRYTMRGLPSLVSVGPGELLGQAGDRARTDLVDHRLRARSVTFLTSDAGAAGGR